MNKESLNKIEKLEQEDKELKEQLKKKKERWKPREGEEFFFVGEHDRNYNHKFDKTRILMGNSYKSRELAERQIEKEKLIVVTVVGLFLIFSSCVYFYIYIIIYVYNTYINKRMRLI